MRASIGCLILLLGTFTCGDIEEIQEQLEKAEAFKASSDFDDLTTRLCLLDEGCTHGRLDLDQHTWILMSEDYTLNEEESIRSGIGDWQRVFDNWTPCVGRRHVSDAILINQSLTIDRTYLFLNNGQVQTSVFYWSDEQYAVAHIDPRLAYPATILREVAAHVIGHALGLGDVEGETDSIMRWPVRENSAPTTEDVRAVCELHPEMGCE